MPLAPREPLAGFQPHLALKEWDRERGYVTPVSQVRLADLYVCWKPAALYLGVYAQDVVEPRCYRDKRVPESDRSEWVVRTARNRRTIRARIGAGVPVVVDDPSVRVVHLSGVDLNTRCIAAMELPARLFGRSKFESGDRVGFSSTLRTHCRTYRTDWHGTFTLRGSL